MNIKLIKISIINFKGIQNLVINFAGENTCIYGANATGKTTIVDSYLWCLFGKNYKGESNFNIKPLEKGKIKHKVDNEVVVVISIDDIQTIFKKIQKENWVRKRNSEIEELKGNEIYYYIDNVPYSANNFKSYIDNIIKENLFKVLTNPEYFNTVLTWEQRREVITRIAGDISNKDVALQSIDFAKLLEEINGKSIIDKKKEITILKNKLKEDASSIPARIDECEKKIPQTHDAENLQKQIAQSLKDRIEELNQQLLIINQQIADLEKTENVINRFIKTKITMVEERVNKLFSYVTFKMFNILINDEDEEPTCEALINGIPYNSANAAAQKNAGIDIINTLSNYYHINCPIFLDNAESTNMFIPSVGQVIKMYVIDSCPTSPEAEKNYKDFYEKQGILLT